MGEGRMNDKKKSFKNGSMLGIGTAIGAAIFAATNEPVWLAVGVALGAALSYRKSK
jgi:amino acid transporter